MEKEYLGRANSLYKTVLIGVNSLGFIIGGFITEKLGVRVSLLISGISLLVLYCIASLLYRNISKKKIKEEQYKTLEDLEEYKNTHNQQSNTLWRKARYGFIRQEKKKGKQLTNRKDNCQ